MTGPLLAPSSVQEPARMSQVLPTVKCSNCSQPVPFAELGEHTCTTPPVPAIPKPAPVTSASKTILARVASPGLPTAGPPPRHSATPSLRPSPSPQPTTRLGPPPNDRPRINVNTRVGVPTASPQRSSPLAPPGHARTDTSTSFQRPPTTSPLRPTLPTSPWPADGRARSASSIASLSPLSSSPATRAPHPRSNPGSFAPGPSQLPPPPSMPAPRVVSFVPESEIGIDTKSGGAAGMAGVGRRGFAAAVRAGMFVSSLGLPADRRPNPPRFLDIDAASRSTDTPPLSASSGYSSHSPGPLSPVPQAELVPEPVPKQPRSPSPSQPIRNSAMDQLPVPSKSPVEDISTGASIPPLTRLPFFEKYKNKIPGVSSGSEPAPTSHEALMHPSQRSPPRTSKEILRDTMSSKYSNDSPLLRNLSISTVTSQRPKWGGESLPSPDTDSEYGLAYADSTDDEGSNPARETRVSLNSKGSSQPTRNSASSILRSGGRGNTGGRVHFPPETSHSAPRQTRSDHSRDNSTLSSHSLRSGSIRSGGGSAAVSGRQRSGSGSSSDGKSNYSRATSAGPTMGMGALERTMETLMEDSETGGSLEGKDNASLSGSRSGERQRSLGQGSTRSHLRGESQDKGIGFVTMSSGPKARRSNTVQVPHSPENKSPKLPTRAKTTAAADTNKSGLDVPTNEVARKKDRARKTRICLRCEKKIEDGRWVRVDTGGALCERCWKNMYLPKCRRCQLPIEKQAVSSADGQLKGKYHKECFNCHVCNKPFPDKSFYVYDGKPLCAYHYHEANDSLCAATLCGQPIEGPCAVSHAGDKYHPEHMTCEHPGNPPCRERLTEYWEIDGRMLCERHAAKASRNEEGEDEDEEWTKTSKAKKRVTRFIDLAGGNLGGTGTESESLL